MTTSKRSSVAKRRGRKPNSATRSPAQVQSLSRGLLLLERIAENPDGVTLTDIAQQVGLAPSTTHRLLATLEHAGFANQNEELAKWYVGVKAFVVGHAFLASRDMILQSREFLTQLMEASGETTNLGMMQDGEGIIVAQAECHEMMRMVVPLGSRVPLHASGVGKALLSAVTEKEVADILHARGLHRYTEHTIDRPKTLRVELNEIRARGYSVDDEEHAVGLRCVAAPIFDEHGRPLAALSISGPRSRIPSDRLPHLGSLVLEVSQQIMEQVGGKRPESL